VSTPKPDYKAIATEAVDLLCRVGYLGLDRSNECRLWQMALDLDRKLNPHRERTIVWTEEEGDVDPPRRSRRERTDRCMGQHGAATPNTTRATARSLAARTIYVPARNAARRASSSVPVRMSARCGRPRSDVTRHDR
jgi:hypothetical protein